MVLSRESVGLGLAALHCCGTFADGVRRGADVVLGYQPATLPQVSCLRLAAWQRRDCASWLRVLGVPVKCGGDPPLDAVLS